MKLQLVLGSLLLSSSALAAFALQPVFAAETANYAYIGTYTRDAPGGDSGEAKSDGIYVASVDSQNGQMEIIQTVASDNPSFLALSPNQQYLYAINEVADYQGNAQGSVEAYRIDPDNGMISLINRQALPGPIPAQLAVDPSGQFLVVAIYMGGSYVVMPIEDDGRLGLPTSEIFQYGSGPNSERQEGSHPHAVVFDPSGKYLATADLGIDRVEVFTLPAGNLERISAATMTPGAGPRHVAFNPEGDMLYVINELNATIVALPFDAQTGQLGTAVATVSTVPDGFPEEKSTAEIMVHPSGKFLYGSNRRFSDHMYADSIAVYQLDDEGIPSRIQIATAGIQFPRAFQFDPTGTWLYVLNQKGDDIIQFAIDQETGKLTPTGVVLQVPTPVSMVFTTTDTDN